MYDHHISILNYTPHSVTLLRADNSVEMRFDSVGVARCKEIVQPLQPLTYDPFGDGGMRCHAPLVRKTFAAVENLPPVDPSTPWRMYIVSQIVADACPDREDLLVPSDVVRDATGQVLGCRAFAWRPAQVEGVGKAMPGTAMVTRG